MVRIKVIKASRLLLGFAIVLLVVVLAIMAIRFALAGGFGKSPVFQFLPEAKKAAAQEVAAAFSAFGGGNAPPLDIVVVQAAEDALTAPGKSELSENEHTDAEVPQVQIEIIQSQPEETASPDAMRSADAAFAAAAPSVLIYHTHTTEAYRQVASDPYVETEAWRTADPSHSIVRVGEALAQLLTASGFSVTHNVVNHEPPELTTAYSRSLETILSYGKQYDLYIDVHRDAYYKGVGENVIVAGAQAARVMVLLGKGDQHEVKPDLEENMRFATLFTDRVNALVPGMGRKVMVKTGRYNQHVGKPAMILEVGHNENSLAEALASVPYIADALYEAYITYAGFSKSD